MQKKWKKQRHRKRRGVTLRLSLCTLLCAVCTFLKIFGGIRPAPWEPFGGTLETLTPFGFALIPTSLNLSGYKFDKFNDFFICPALRTQVLNQAKNFAACHFVHFPFTCLFYIHGLRRVDLISRRPRTEPVPFSGASRGLVPLGSVVRWFCSTSDRLKITRLRRTGGNLYFS